MNVDSVIESLAKASEKSIPANDEDYLNEDGLLVCWKCNTLKQTIVEFNGKVIKPRCLCKCEQEKMEAEKEADNKKQRMIRISEMRKTGFPDAEMERCTFENDDNSNDKISTIARNYVDNFEQMKSKRKGLLLFGTVGTGKTYISACIANALIDKGYPALVTSFSRITNTISGMYEGKQNYIDSLNEFDLLVIDDLASERDTEYMNDIVMNIIDSRYRSGKPLIVTTNLTSQELKNPQEIRKQRIYSRLLEMCIPVEVKGIDRRKEKLRNEYSELEGLLGL